MRPAEIVRLYPTLDQRLRRLGWTVTASGCWEWAACRQASGYGLMQWDGRLQCAHRLAHEAWIGAIPDGHEIDHLCNNPPCINPDHLEAVTHAENMRRRVMRNTHCGQGHAFADGNTYWYRGQRRCRTCRAAADERRRLRNRATGAPIPSRPTTTHA